MKVGVLGPRGTYSELAAKKQFGEKVTIVPYPKITDVANAVASKKINFGVIPVESLREGSVGEALDAIAWTDIKVHAEIVAPISHSLLGVPGSKLVQIAQVLSHPQALAQCREFLRKNLPKAELIEVTSTAKAAEQVGIANPRAATRPRSHSTPPKTSRVSFTRYWVSSRFVT